MADEDDAWCAVIETSVAELTSTDLVPGVNGVVVGDGLAPKVC